MAAALEADVIDRAAQVGLGFAVDDEVASTWLTALEDVPWDSDGGPFKRGCHVGSSPTRVSR